jgi:hypothetical protein
MEVDWICCGRSIVPSHEACRMAPGAEIDQKQEDESPSQDYEPFTSAAVAYMSRPALRLADSREVQTFITGATDFTRRRGVALSIDQRSFEEECCAVVNSGVQYSNWSGGMSLSVGWANAELGNEAERLDGNVLKVEE